MGLLSVTSFVFALSAFASGTYAQVAQQCPNGETVVFCIIDPCLSTLCAEGHTCEASYCGSCRGICKPVNDTGSCKYDGKVYKDGASGIPSTDGCNTCFCENGQIGCTELACEVSGGDEFCPNGDPRVVCIIDPCSLSLCEQGQRCEAPCGSCKGQCVPAAPQCPNGETVVNCVINPCLSTLCAKGHTCEASYCGSCRGICKPVTNTGSCKYNGNVYKDGASGIPATDGCNTCFCENGQIGCTEKACGVSGGGDLCPNGNPRVFCIIDPCSLSLCEQGQQCEAPCGSCQGQCVPVIATGSCKYDGNVYKNGASGIPATDGCNTCFCENGRIGCTEKACGAPTEPECPVDKPRVDCFDDPCRTMKCSAGFECKTSYCGACEGNCVPVSGGGDLCPNGDPRVFCIIDPCSLSLCEQGQRCEAPCGSCQGQCVPDPVTCKYNGQIYKPGSPFKSSDGCNSCSCTDTGLVVCTKKFCLPETCKFGNKVYNVGDHFPSGDGCNNCGCQAGGGVVCTLAVCEQPVCKYSGKEYKAGDTFPSTDGCNKCECLTTEAVSCTKKACFQCPMLKCRQCSNGYYTDRNGCQTCNCKPCGFKVCRSTEFCSNDECCPNFVKTIRCTNPCDKKYCGSWKKCETYCNCFARCVWDWSFILGFKK